VRLTHQMRSALKVAAWLKGRPEVKQVLYPALEGDPGHSIWKRDFSGASGLFSFVMQATHDKQVPTFINTLELFGIGSSWGGYESLAVVAHADRYRSATKWNPGGETIRLHIGLEDPDDLIADLERGFAAMKKA
jgi:cystathionine beta-lyase